MLGILISTQIPADVQFLIIFLLFQAQHHHQAENPSLQCTLLYAGKNWQKLISKSALQEGAQVT